MGQPEQNKELVRRYFEDLWGEGDAALFDKYLHPTFYQHHPRNHDEDLLKPASLRTWLTAVRDTVSKMRMQVELIFAEQDQVMVHLHGSGTYQADPKKPSSGAPLKWTTTAMVRVTEDKIAESWVISDSLGILQQIGAVPKLG